MVFKYSYLVQIILDRSIWSIDRTLIGTNRVGLDIMTTKEYSTLFLVGKQWMQFRIVHRTPLLEVLPSAGESVNVFKVLSVDFVGHTNKSKVNLQCLEKKENTA